MRLLLACTVLLLIAACESREAPMSQLPWQLDARQVALEELPAPSQLGEFELQGQMENPDAKIRVLRYVHGDSELRMDISLYPMPPGWDGMDPERTIAGHYPQVQESVTRRALRQGASEVALVDSEMYTPEGAPYPILSSRLEQVFPSRDDRVALVELTGRMPILMYAVMILPEERLEQMPEAVHGALLAYLAAMEDAEREAGVDPDEMHQTGT